MTYFRSFKHNQKNLKSVVQSKNSSIVLIGFCVYSDGEQIIERELIFSSFTHEKLSVIKFKELQSSTE